MRTSVVYDWKVRADATSGRRAPGACRRCSRPSRTNPTTVTPSRSPASTASEDGALTALTTGTPATAAFCTISNDARPETWSTRSDSGQRAGQQLLADHLVDRVVPTDVLPDAEQPAVGG